MYKTEPKAANTLFSKEMVSVVLRAMGPVNVSLHTMSNQSQSMAFYSLKKEGQKGGMMSQELNASDFTPGDGKTWSSAPSPFPTRRDRQTPKILLRSLGCIPPRMEFNAGCSEGLRNSQPNSCSVACRVSDIQTTLLTFLITVKHAIWAGGPQGTVCCNCIYKTHRDEILSWGSNKICAYTGGTILPAMLLAPMAQEGEEISRGPRQERMGIDSKASC